MIYNCPFFWTFSFWNKGLQHFGPDTKWLQPLDYRRWLMNGWSQCCPIEIVFIENVLYIMQGGLGLAVGRGLFAVPAHFFFAIFMGYFFSLARFRYEKRQSYMILAYIIPVFLHGTYDFLLMFVNNLTGDTDTMQEVSPLAGILYVVFLVFFFFVWRFAVRKMSGQ